MANYSVIPVKVVIQGKPFIISLIENPIIDDVLITEARIQAISIYNQDDSADDRIVDRGIRDYLIRLGVER